MGRLGKWHVVEARYGGRLPLVRKTVCGNNFHLVRLFHLGAPWGGTRKRGNATQRVGWKQLSCLWWGTSSSIARPVLVGERRRPEVTRVGWVTASPDACKWSVPSLTFSSINAKFSPLWTPLMIKSIETVARVTLTKSKQRAPKHMSLISSAVTGCTPISVLKPTYTFVCVLTSTTNSG